MSAQHKWFNKFNNTRLVTVAKKDKYYQFPNYGDEPDTLPIHEHMQAIFQAIETDDAARLTDLLSYELQCSMVEDSVERELDNEGRETPAKYQISTRPFIEGLLFLNYIDLHDLVKKIADQENVDLWNAFINNLDQTTLSKTQLFNWTKSDIRNVTIAIQNLENYGDKLIADGLKKGDLIIEHCQQLIDKLATIPEHEFIEKKPRPVSESVNQNSQESLRSLQFKLEFCELLHNQDKFFNRHREYKNMIMDIALMVISVGLLNLGNYIFTGNFLFFNKTATQLRIEQVDEVIRPYNLDR